MERKGRLSTSSEQTGLPFERRGPDWGLGRYEDAAARFRAGRSCGRRARPPASGEAVLDIGCRTGNAALLAAECGARVTGVDPARRLLDVARRRPRRAGSARGSVLGHAAALPLADGEADVVLSVFGVVFAPDPHTAAAEMARVTAPGGRIVLSAWIPSGAIHEAVHAAEEAVRNALGAPAGPPPFPWHERTALVELFAPHGFEITLDEDCLAFTAPSPQAYVDEQEHHPLAVAGQAVLGPRGESDAVRERMLAILAAANEDPNAFRVTSRYVAATARNRG